MRKIILALLAVCMATPALADRPYYDTYNHRWVGGGYDYRGYDRYRGYRHRDRDAGDVIVPIIGGIILGAILTQGSNRQDRYDSNEVYRQPPPRTYTYDPRCDCYRR